MSCWTISPARSTSELADDAFATLLAEACSRIAAAAIPDDAVQLTQLMQIRLAPEH